jgi:hypothetical protein
VGADQGLGDGLAGEAVSLDQHGVGGLLQLMDASLSAATLGRRIDLNGMRPVLRSRTWNVADTGAGGKRWDVPGMNAPRAEADEVDDHRSDHQGEKK